MASNICRSLDRGTLRRDARHAARTLIVLHSLYFMASEIVLKIASKIVLKIASEIVLKHRYLTGPLDVQYRRTVHHIDRLGALTRSQVRNRFKSRRRNCFER